MTVNVHIAARTLTGRAAGMIAGVVATYGLVQKAADSAHPLQVQYPAWHFALYMQQLEMMYFLIEPVFERGNLDFYHLCTDQ